MARKTIFLLFLLALVMPAVPTNAQWGFYTSTRDVYQLFQENQRGMFFPEKDPEEQEITLGPVEVRPGLGVSETWTSNVTLAPLGAQDDFYTQLFPALRLKLPYKKNLFEAEYMGHFSWYIDHPDYNTNDHYFSARAKVSLFEDSWIQIESITALLHTPVEDIRTYTIQFNRRRRFNYYKNYISFNPASYKRFALMVEYDNTISCFAKEIDKEDNYTRHHPGILLGYSVYRKIRLLLGYAFTDYRASERTINNDYHEHRLISGVEWTLPHQLQLNLRVEYNWDYYSNSGVNPQFWGANMNLQYSPLERLTIQLRYARLSNPTVTYTGDQSDPITGIGSIYYIEDRASGSCAYRFRKNILVWANFMYKRLDFPPDGRLGTERLDNIYGGTGQIIYRFRPWLRFSLAGGYSRAQSTEILEGYEDIFSQLYVQCAF